MNLRELQNRPGLSPDLRLLIRAKVLIWPGDWPELEACCKTARDQDVSRTWFEEMLLQAVLFCGFPRCIEAFHAFAKAWPTAEPPGGGGLPVGEQREAGATLFAQIYGKNTDAVRDMLRRHHAELHDFVIESAYGRILARPGLTPKVRELLAVAALATMQQKPQLIAHARGALAFGASEKEVEEAIFTGILDEAAARKLIHTTTSSKNRS